eukprot:scaffold4494_cov79-Skeletonema_dohrnii-CCMP3373.AAC.2
MGHGIHGHDGDVYGLWWMLMRMMVWKTIWSEDAAELHCCLSFAFANHLQLQMREGPITDADGLVDILLPAGEEDAVNNFHIMPFHGRRALASAKETGRERNSIFSAGSNMVNPNSDHELTAFRKRAKMDASTNSILSDDANWHRFNLEWTALWHLYGMYGCYCSSMHNHNKWNYYYYSPSNILIIIITITLFI